MPNALPEELQQFVDHEIASGRYHSADDLVVAGLRLLQHDRQEAAEAIKEGLAEMERGEGIPLEDVIANIRKKYDLRADT